MACLLFCGRLFKISLTAEQEENHIFGGTSYSETHPITYLFGAAMSTLDQQTQAFTFTKLGFQNNNTKTLVFSFHLNAELFFNASFARGLRPVARSAQSPKEGDVVLKEKSLSATY